MSHKYADLHLHVSLKHYINELGDIWYHNPYKLELPNRSKATEYTQSDVTSLHMGGVDLAVVALYPLEGVVHKTGFGRFVAKTIFGFKTRNIKKLIRKFDTNFALLEHERKFIEAGPFEKNNRNYHIVETKSDLKKEGPKLIFSLEGAHGLMGTSNPSSSSYQTDILNHLAQIKKDWVHPPFMMTLCHFAYNGVADQAWAIPLPGIINPFLSKKIKRALSNTNQGISELGWTVIKKALDNNDGKRILIDLKHCSTKTRMQYYDFVRQQFEKNEVPIIFSHAGVSGINTFSEQISFDNKSKKAAKKSKKFNPWEINLCNDDIRVIAGNTKDAIGGMIGVSLDQRIVGDNSSTFKKDICKRLEKVDLPTHNRNVHAMMFLENVLHIVATANHKEAWSKICLSSDNDGIIDPLNSCPTAQHLRKFEERLANNSFKYLQVSEYKDQVFVDSNEELIANLRKVLYDNLRKFIEDYFPA